MPLLHLFSCHIWIVRDHTNALYGARNEIWIYTFKFPACAGNLHLQKQRKSRKENRDLR